MWFKVVSY
jgi:hypothetical protein